MQAHAQYQYITILHDSYFPLTELLLKLCTYMGVVHFCENAHLLSHRSEQTHAPAI